MTDRKWRWFLGIFSTFMVVLPMLVVRYPPSFDLPQHIAQVRLLAEALHDPAGPYRIQWYTPYSAITLLAGLAWELTTPLDVGRVTLIALGVAWTAAAHWIAARRGRSPEAAMLASIPFLGLSLYRGLCSFIIGWPAFLVWLELTAKPPETVRKRDAAWLSACAALLYVCHALWLAAGIAWLAVVLIWRRPPRRVVVWFGVALLPIIVLAAVWWLTLPHSDYSVGARWGEAPWSRLSPLWLASATFFGLHGPTNLIVLLALLAWSAAGIWLSRGTLDRYLAGAAAIFLLAVLVLPSDLSFTILLCERFAAPALILLLLSAPAPPLRPAIARAVAIGVLVVYCGSTAMAWKAFDDSSFSGFDEAVNALPEHPRVLGMDFLRRSPFVIGSPFTHQAAYAQVAKGGVLGYSFAEMPSPLVVFKDRRWREWRADLEIKPERTRDTDLRYFDYVIVGGSDAKQAETAARLALTPITSTGLWRLYRTPSNGNSPARPASPASQPL